MLVVRSGACILIIIIVVVVFIGIHLYGYSSN